jgi:hypothetical protein
VYIRGKVKVKDKVEVEVKDKVKVKQETTFSHRFNYFKVPLNLNLYTTRVLDVKKTIITLKPPQPQPQPQPSLP